MASSWGLTAFVFGRQVIKMLVIVVALFALCWLPLQTYNVLQDVFPEING
jgi:leucokinin receptor